MTSPERARLVWCVMAVCAVCAPSLAHAQAAREEPARRAVLADGFQFVGAELEGSGEARLDEGMRRAAARYVATHPEDYAYVGGASLESELEETANHEAQLKLARDATQLGLEAFRQLDRARALDLLGRALEYYDALLHDLTAPEEVAEVLLYLALSELDEKRTLTAIEHMQRMILLDASRELQRGYWPDDAVDAYAQARRGLERDLRLGPQRFVARARAIASRLDADVVYFSAALPAQGGQVEVLLFPFVAARDAFDVTERALLTGPTAARVEDATGRLMSRHASCLREAQEDARPIVPPSQGRSPLSIQVSMSYTSFLRYPRTLDVPFGNYGLGLGAQWLLTRDFGLVSSVQVLTSQSQYSGLVATESFPTIRGFLGAELGYRLGNWRASMQVAGDLTHVSEFAVWGNVPCVTRTDCNPDLDQITYDEYGLMLGVNARPSISYRLDRSLELIARASGSYFFLAGGSELNFPLGADLGLEYRF